MWTFNSYWLMQGSDAFYKTIQVFQLSLPDVGIFISTISITYYFNILSQWCKQTRTHIQFIFPTFYKPINALWWSNKNLSRIIKYLDGVYFNQWGKSLKSSWSFSQVLQCVTCFSIIGNFIITNDGLGYTYKHFTIY